MTEDEVHSGRQIKNSRNNNNYCTSVIQSNGCTDPIVIMDPAIDSPANLSETRNSPIKVEEQNHELCALCNCGDEMALILGQLTRYQVSLNTLKKCEKVKQEVLSPLLVSKVEERDKQEMDLPPDMTAFGTGTMQDFSDVLDSEGCIWSHHCCAAWSAGVCQTDSYDLENVDKAVSKALRKKCSHCFRYGASVECQVQRCSKLFHYPCCASAGAFQNITSMILLCPEHLDRSEKLADAKAFCDTCQKTDNMRSQLFCTSCGRHFHSYCVEMNIPITPVVRMGWQCSFCKVCQGCKQPGDEEKMLCCDQCDKGYHTYCLVPPISNIPKSVWKCKSCLKCSNCGMTDASCEWHNNFSQCDACYKQKKLGQVCLGCKRSIELHNETMQCVKCGKHVHKECCSEDGSFVCADCAKDDVERQDETFDEASESVSSFDLDLLATGQKIISIEEAQLFSIAASADFINLCSKEPTYNEVKMESDEDYVDKASESTIDSPYSSSLLSESFTDNTPQSKQNAEPRRTRRFKSFCGKQRLRESNNYNGMRRRISNDSDPMKVTNEASVAMNKQVSRGVDEEEDGTETGLHSTVVIVSTRDSYTLKQDICMCCGSLGKDDEGYLIGCVQCGQCFHPYCVNVKINEVILTRDWRCLDCTVCEGCGRNADEGHLLLCDACDVSFHTYCLDPPLEEVPVGGWKCQWCVTCEDCGAKEAGYNSTWMANYTQCGPCSSEQFCSMCSYAYEPNNLVIQCEKCNRWSHGECDGLYSEEDADLACSMLYHCSHCRPKTKHLGIYSSLRTSIISKVSARKTINGTSFIQRKTKTLHSLKSKKLSRSELREQKRIELEAMPLIPQDVTTDECGTFNVDLVQLKARLRMDDIEKPNFHLTETGLKEIKMQVIRAPIQRGSMRKERGNVRGKRDDTKSSIMLEEVSCSVDGEDGVPMGNLETPFDLETLGGELLSPEMLSVKHEEMEIDLMQPDTTQEDFPGDDEESTQETEDVTDPFEFFGVNLLEKHLNMELESLESSAHRKKLKKEKKKERRLKRAAKLAESMQVPSVPDPTALLAHPPKPLMPSVIEKLDLITPEGVPPPLKEMQQPSSDVNKVKDLTPNKGDQKAVEIIEIDSSTNPVNHMQHNDDPSHLELMNVLDLPHVAGHEVEQMFAGLEREMDYSQKFMANKINKPEPSLLANRQHIPIPGLPQPPLDHHMKFSSSPMLSSTKSPLVSPANAMKAAGFTAEKDYQRKKDPSAIAKMDTQKQIRKWGMDEPLGENATISPVLYCNMMHKNLKLDYLDWPNRARAIARLWRKLPNEQREPFRVRARENRVKLKEKKSSRRQPTREPYSPQNPVLQNHDPFVPKFTTPEQQEDHLSPKFSIATSVSMSSLLHPTTRPIHPDNPAILSVPEPQKLSPLLQTLSPQYSISSLTGLTPSSPHSPFFGNIPSMKQQPPSTIHDVPKPPQKLDHFQQPKIELPDKQSKLQHQERIFEQQRQAILKQDKNFEQGEVPQAVHGIESAKVESENTGTVTGKGNTVSIDTNNLTTLQNEGAKNPSAAESISTANLNEISGNRRTEMDSYFHRSMEYSNQMRGVDQQQAYAIHQRYMIAQQQYIQMQLAQQNSAMDGMYNMQQKPPDKDLPDVDNEQEHQERIRFLFHQQQGHKEPRYPPTTPVKGPNTSADQNPSPHQYDQMHTPAPPMLGAGYPRLPQFLPSNAAESPVYHQMVLEYMARYRKSLEKDTAGPSMSQVHNTIMAEFAKQYHQRQFSKYYPHPQQSFPFSPQPEFPGYDERALYGGYKPPNDFYPPFQQPGVTPPKPTTENLESDEKNRNYSSTSLQRSSLFQISRTAADSTSNDELLPAKDANPNESEQGSGNFVTSENNENEITSSKVIDNNTESEPKTTSNRDHLGTDDEDDQLNRNRDMTPKYNRQSSIDDDRCVVCCVRRKPQRFIVDDEEHLLGRGEQEESDDNSSCDADDGNDSENERLGFSYRIVSSDCKDDNGEGGNENIEHKDVFSQKEGVYQQTESKPTDDRMSAYNFNDKNTYLDKYAMEQSAFNEPMFQPGGGNAPQFPGGHQPSMFPGSHAPSFHGMPFHHPSLFQNPNNISNVNQQIDAREKMNISQHSVKGDVMPDWAAFTGAIKGNFPQKSEEPYNVSLEQRVTNIDNPMFKISTPSNVFPQTPSAFPTTVSSSDTSFIPTSNFPSTTISPFTSSKSPYPTGASGSPFPPTSFPQTSGISFSTSTMTDTQLPPSTSTPPVPSTSPFKSKSNVISLHPGSSNYHQMFIYQHQLLIMQFQQYQFQLQVQFQQLSQQQLSQHQQYLLQQQFHQQMMLLQQHFFQQQAELHRMAAKGIQFTEHQLNTMYQQQILTHQSYRQWLAALTPDQQISMQQRLHSSMQQVHHQLTQIMQRCPRKEEEQKKKPTKPRRSLNKKKTAASLAASLIPPNGQPQLPVTTKFPVPELSEEMKIRTGQKVNYPGTPQVDGMKSEPTNVVKPSEPVKTKPDDKIVTGSLISPQFEEIQKSFLMHQKQIRGEIPPAPLQPDAGISHNDISEQEHRNAGLPKPVFFPTHPSQLLKQAHRKSDPIKSPPSTKTNQDATLPMGETPSFGSRPGMASNEKSRLIPPVLPTSLRAENRPNTFSVSHLLGAANNPTHVAQQSVINSTHKSVNPSANLASPKQTSVLGPKQGNHMDLLYESMYQMNEGEGFDVELKKNLMKQSLLKKKEKQFDEKKKQKEVDRIKKKEEKEKLKVFKEQRKADKVQQRMLKQKALQEAKSLTTANLKRKPKITPISVLDMPTTSSATTSPAQLFTPKSPLMASAPKIPLCEPDVSLVCPLVQPFGFSCVSVLLLGVFGTGSFDNFSDVYCKPFPPVNSVNVLSSQKCSVVVTDILNHGTMFDGEDSKIMKLEESIEDLELISRCNFCYSPLNEGVLYVDKNMDTVTMCKLNKFELVTSDQLAFCTNDCVEAFQRKVNFTFDNDDQELIDAVKTAAMVTIDESRIFSPLPMEESRGNIYAETAKNTKSPRHWKRWHFSQVQGKQTSGEDIVRLMKKYSVAIKPSDSIHDKRTCLLCNHVGDGDGTLTSRLLNCDVDCWVHLNCALWSSEVYEALNGGLHNVERALSRAKYTKCYACARFGATLNCSHSFGAQQRLHCERSFHFPCAVQAKCAFYKDKTLLCPEHKPLGVRKEELEGFSVLRKVYVERNITKQISRMLNLNNTLDRKEYTFRVGNLIFHELGHVPNHLLDSFSTKDYVYPVGYEITLIFWDHHTARKRRYYTCSISERLKSPRFKVKSQHNGTEGLQYTSCSAKGAWDEIVANIQALRQKEDSLKIFPEFICGEDLFGLAEPTIQRMIESLPGIDTIPNYNFRFGRTPILISELPLALNPSGCIRSEKCRKHHSRPLAMRSATEHTPTSDPVLTDDTWLLYSQRSAHIMNTKTGQYRRMRQEWRHSVVLGRSRIQGLGLFIKKDIEENTFVIEYIGSLIRNEVANRLEKLYERQNRGIYMFRIDSETVVDATMAGGPARYINHSCDSNCVAEIVSIEKEKKIIIISSRKIEKGEELTYDYKFEFEDDSEKLACLCGSSNCRKWMN